MSPATAETPKTSLPQEPEIKVQDVVRTLPEEPPRAEATPTEDRPTLVPNLADEATPTPLAPNQETEKLESESNQDLPRTDSVPKQEPAKDLETQGGQSSTLLVVKAEHQEEVALNAPSLVEATQSNQVGVAVPAATMETSKVEQTSAESAQMVNSDLVADQPVQVTSSQDQPSLMGSLTPSAPALIDLEEAGVVAERGVASREYQVVYPKLEGILDGENQIRSHDSGNPHDGPVA